MSFAEAPQDVLLEVIKQLDVVDLFNLLSVCRTIRELQWQKTLWLDALARIREVEMHPLPLAPAMQLDSMSREELQAVAHRAHRLTQNLTSDKPVPVKTHTLLVPWYFSPELHTSCVCLPGSNLLVTYSDGSVSCWDVLTARRVAHLEVVALRIIDKPRIEQNGKALFGARLHADQLAVVYVDYQDRGQVSISHVTSPPTNALRWHGRNELFVNSDVMGFCTSASTVYWSMEKASAVRTGTAVIPAMIDSLPSLPGPCLVHGSNIYILYRAGETLKVRIERHPFPRTADELVLATPSDPPKIWTPSVPYPFTAERLGKIIAVLQLLHPTQVQVPEYGVYAVAGSIYEWGDSRTSVVHFWPGRVVQGKVDFGADGFYYATDRVMAKMAVGRSGRYVLVLVREGDMFVTEAGAAGESYLGLVHVELSPTPHITFRKLEVEGLPPVLSIVQLALDDTLGLVVVVDRKGAVSVTSYV
ncbi:hypothetical protein C8R46DRAFT_1354070 [Mycena filopes]|nr:hypothetical protein C8R46DRAFT_1354070 [Mycena filopes]